MSICGATDTPVSDFWWCLLWVSKPEWVLPYSNFVEAYVIYFPWDSPLPVYTASIAASRLPHTQTVKLSTVFRGIGWLEKRHIKWIHLVDK